MHCFPIPNMAKNMGGNMHCFMVACRMLHSTGCMASGRMQHSCMSIT